MLDKTEVAVAVAVMEVQGGGNTHDGQRQGSVCMDRTEMERIEIVLNFKFFQVDGR